jgi:hypothetical protein
MPEYKIERNIVLVTYECTRGCSSKLVECMYMCVAELYDVHMCMN